VQYPFHWAETPLQEGVKFNKLHTRLALFVGQKILWLRHWFLYINMLNNRNLCNAYLEQLLLVCMFGDSTHFPPLLYVILTFVQYARLQCDHCLCKRFSIRDKTRCNLFPFYFGSLFKRSMAQIYYSSVFLS
jgi:hypothetical protein